MVSVAEAESIIQSNLIAPEIIEVEIQHAVGHILAENIFADRDLPPFNRVAMDGIAIKQDSFKNGVRTFKNEGIQAAGTPQKRLQSDDGCLEVMTGAMLPEGTDTVVRYEDVEFNDGKATVLINEIPQNIHPQGQDAKAGELLLTPGIKISSAEIALFATVGKSKVKVIILPPVAIISTGDELVEINETPDPWQIRRSNVFTLQGAFKEMSLLADEFHLPDDEESIERKLTHIFDNYRVVILSGGVSKGKFDYIPTALEKLGVQKLFHQVSQRPGKPFWFGKNERLTVFALPGNPVSTFLCFNRYIKPWINACYGHHVKNSSAILAKDFTFKVPLTYFLQVRIENEEGKLMAYPDAGGGSGDFANLKEVDGFIELPLEKSFFKAGEVFPYYSFRS